MFDSEEYNFFNDLILRAPFYSLDAYSPDLLPEILGQQVFRNALLLASPDLYRSIEKKGFNYDELLDKERLTLFKYYNRMSFRPTPFGAFASVSVVSWTHADGMRFGPPESATLHLLPSLEAKVDVGTSSGSANRPGMLAANPTLYKFGPTWRYIASRTVESVKLEFSIQAIASLPLNDHLIALASVKPVERAVLIRKTAELTNCLSQEAEDYIAFLEKGQVLLSEQSPGMFEQEAPDGLFTIGVGEVVPESVAPYRLELTGSRQFIPYYTCMERELKEGGLNIAMQNQLREALNVLARIVPNRPLRTLEEFKARFKVRFDQEKVPLMTALDPDAGIGYGDLHTKVSENLLLDSLIFPAHEVKKEVMEWTAVHRMFFRIWLQYAAHGLHDVVEIKDADLIDLPENPGLQLPPSLAVIFTRTQDQLIIESAGGASGTTLIGRFSVFNDQIFKLGRQVSVQEAKANPEVLFAEIHQRSNNHVDNINRRIQLYDHIVPINVYPASHESGHIVPDDILVSIRGDQVILESVAHVKRVIPRLPTAYNYQHNDLALFRFLCDLQYEGIDSDLTFDPERLFPGLDYYPRFSYHNCILSLAKWCFSKNEISHLLAKPYSLGRLHIFRQEKGIPRLVSLTQGDQQLVFDLGSDQEALFFLKNLRETTVVVIKEYLVPDMGLTADKQLRYAGQFIALLKKEKKVYQGISPATVPVNEIERRFLPGSKWLYLSFYCTTGSADRVLLKVILPVLEQCRINYGDWFFIRYQDPRPHLRVRIKTAPKNIGLLLVAFEYRLKTDVSHDLVSDFKTETYSRELERYSGELINRIEDLFCAGSALSAEILMGNLSENHKVLWPFLVTYAMAARFFFSDLQILEYFVLIRDNFLEEFRADKKFIRELDNKYREISGELIRQMADEYINITQVSVETLDYFARLDQIFLATADWTDRKKSSLLSDLIHMEINRMFAARQRENEAVIYYCLHKFQLSRMAVRNKARVD